MTDAIVEYGKDAHGNEVEAARYVTAPDGRVIRLERHVPMKPGWHESTPHEIEAVLARAHANGAGQAQRNAAELQQQLEASHLKGEIERVEAEANAERAAAKQAAMKQRKVTLTEAEYQERAAAAAAKAAGAKNVSHEEIQQQLAAVQATAELPSVTPTETGEAATPALTGE